MRARLGGLDVLGVGYAVAVIVDDGVGIPLGVNRRIRINGCVSREGLLASKTLKEREDITGLQVKRAPVMLAGTILLARSPSICDTSSSEM